MLEQTNPSLAVNVIGTAEPSAFASPHEKDAMNRVDYACMMRTVAEEGEWTTDGRIYNDPNSPGPYVLIPRCGDVWEVPRADGSVLLLYPMGGEQNWTRTYLHVPPGSYVDCRVKYLSVEQRIEISNIPGDADDGNAFKVTDEGEVVCVPGTFAFTP